MRKLLENIPFFVYYIFIFALNLLINIQFGDDNYFGSSPLSIDFIAKRYTDWSSRVFIEYILIFLCKHDIIFRILNTIIMATMPFLVKYCYEQFFEKININVICTLLLMYQYTEMLSAGWRATLLNYYYPIYTLLLAIIFLNNSKIFFKIISFFLFIFSFNQELLCLTALLFVGILFLKKEYRIGKTIIPIIALFFSLILIIACKGNAHREICETATWFPEYYYYSILDKFYIGFHSTFNYLIGKINILFITFSAVLFLYLKNINSFIVLLLSIAFQITGMTIDVQDIISYKNILKIECYISLLFSITLLLFMMRSFFYIYANDKKNFIICILIMSAIASRIFMGLSPTIFASSNRTFIFLNFSFIFCILYFFTKISDHILFKRELLSILSILCFIKNISIYLGAH